MACALGADKEEVLSAQREVEDGEPLNVGRKTLIISAPLRRLLTARIQEPRKARDVPAGTSALSVGP